MNYLAYFSPTGNTKHAAETFSKMMSLQWETIDITDYNTRNEICLDLTSEDFLLIAVPVYGGRVPFVDNLLKPFNGNDTPCAVCVCFGNRDYDDALLELKNMLNEKNFKCIAGAAMVIPHVYSDILGANRPDSLDMESMREFAASVQKKLDKGAPFESVEVKGNYPYKDWKKSDVTPAVDEKCVKCGLCAKLCPVNAIETENFTGLAEKCVQCMRCVKKCPQNARYLDMSNVKVYLEQNYVRRKENEYFI